MKLPWWYTIVAYFLYSAVNICLLNSFIHIFLFFTIFLEDAFLLSESHVNAMFQCLEAVEQNNPKLLAQIDTVGVGLIFNLIGQECWFHMTFHWLRILALTCSRFHPVAVPSQEPSVPWPVEEPEPVCVARGWWALEKHGLDTQKRVFKPQAYHIWLLPQRCGCNQH